MKVYLIGFFTIPYPISPQTFGPISPQTFGTPNTCESETCVKSPTLWFATMASQHHENTMKRIVIHRPLLYHY